MVEGMYSVEYQSNYGSPGCGIVTLKDGEIQGSDAGYDWQGTYTEVGGMVIARVDIFTERETYNVFGEIGPVELDFEGKKTSEGLLFFGVRRNRPEQRIEVRLKPVEV
jgi:hypothetical protein